MNNGTIFGSASAQGGIGVGAGSTVINTGNTQTSGEGVRTIATGGGATITNSGNITKTGGTNADAAIGIAAGSTIQNDGVIVVTGELGSAIIGTGDLIVNNTGSITSDANGIFADDGFTLANSGTIEGGSIGGIQLLSGSIVNTGTLWQPFRGRILRRQQHRATKFRLQP